MENWTLQEWIVASFVVILIIAVLLFKFRMEIRLRRKGVHAEGVIVNWMSTLEDGRRYYYPLVHFITHEGREVKFRAEERCESEPMFPVGTRVDIKYLPGQPDIREVTYPRDSF